jgi:hypothetical protein
LVPPKGGPSLRGTATSAHRQIRMLRLPLDLRSQTMRDRCAISRPAVKHEPNPPCRASTGAGQDLSPLHCRIWLLGVKSAGRAGAACARDAFGAPCSAERRLPSIPFASSRRAGSDAQRSGQTSFSSPRGDGALGASGDAALVVIGRPRLNRHPRTLSPQAGHPRGHTATVAPEGMVVLRSEATASLTQAGAWHHTARSSSLSDQRPVERGGLR